MVQALIAAIVLALAAAGVQTWRLDAAQDELKAERAAIVNVALTYSENARKADLAATKRVRDAQAGRETERAASQRIADALRADLDRMRGDVAAFAAGGDGDTLAACHDRASSAGELLVDLLRDGEARTGAAEAHAADVRTLQRAWPLKPQQAVAQ